MTVQRTIVHNDAAPCWRRSKLSGTGSRLTTSVARHAVRPAPTAARARRRAERTIGSRGAPIEGRASGPFTRSASPKWVNDLDRTAVLGATYTAFGTRIRADHR